MYFVYRDGKYIDASGQSFRAFLDGRLPALPGERPTLKDWADHMTTAFPEVRLKRYLEMRGADGGPWNRLCALPAFWVGLMYDQTALDAAWDLVKGLDAETREGLRVQASVAALQGEAGGVKLLDLARAAVGLSHAGLVARGLGEGAVLHHEQKVPQLVDHSPKLSPRLRESIGSMPSATPRLGACTRPRLP
mgnify:CR=1 FL=1